MTDRDRDDLLDLPLAGGSAADPERRPSAPGGAPRPVVPAPPPPPPVQAQLPLRPAPPPVPRAPRPVEAVAMRSPTPRRRWPSRLGRLALALALLGGVAAAALTLLRQPPGTVRPSTEALDFGEARVDGTGGLLPLTLAHAGGGRFTVDTLTIVGTGAAEFSLFEEACTGLRLDEGRTCAVRLRFDPKTPGAREASLVVRGDAANLPIAVALTGVGVAPRLALEPALLDFGPRPVGSTSPPVTLALVNTGTAPLTVKAVLLEGATADDFPLRGDDCSGGAVAAGGRCTLTYVFRPSEAGPRQAILRVWGDLPGPPAATSVLGVGTAPLLAARPQRLDWGERPLRAPPATAKVRVENPGSAPQAVSGVTVSGAGFSLARDGCGRRRLAPGSACEVTVGFAPVVAGEAAGSLEIVAVGEDGGLAVALSGRGVALELVASPTRIEFGGARVGAAVEKAVALENRGLASVRVSAPELLGEDRAAFALSRDRCAGRALGGGGRCTATVAFRPAREGAHRATLRFRGSAGSTAEIELVGGASAPGLAVAGLGGGGALDLGTVAVGTSAERRLELSNPGSAALAIAAIRLEGEAAAAGVWRIDGSACPQRLVPGGFCAVALRFAPQAPGPAPATLVVENDAPGGTRRVGLAGIGTPAPVGLLAVTPPRQLRFGEEVVGQRGGIVEVRLANAGAARLALSDFAVRGAAAGDFKIVPGSCPPFLVPEGTCAFGLRFAPTAPGDRRARLVIRHDGPAGETAIELLGRGLGGG